MYSYPWKTGAELWTTRWAAWWTGAAWWTAWWVAWWTTGTAWATTAWCCCLQAWVSRVRVICSQLGSPMMISFWSTVLVASTNLATLKHLFSILSSHLTSVMVMSLVTHTSLGAG